MNKVKEFNRLAEEAKELRNTLLDGFSSLRHDQLNTLRSAVDRLFNLNAVLLETVFAEVNQTQLKVDALLRELDIPYTTLVSEPLAASVPEPKPLIVSKKVYTIYLTEVSLKIRSSFRSVSLIKKKLFFFETVRRLLAKHPKEKLDCAFIKKVLPRLTGYIHRSPRRMWNGFGEFKNEYSDFIEGKGVWATFDVHFVD